VSISYLDWDDTGPTVIDVSPFALEGAAKKEPLEPTPTPRHSFIRTKPAPVTPTAPANGSTELRAWVSKHLEAKRFIDSMADRQLDLTVELATLENAATEVTKDAAAQMLRARAQEISDVRDALNEVYLDAGEAPELAELFAPGAILAQYVSGIYLWCDATIVALGAFAMSLKGGSTDRCALRAALAEASGWYFDGLAEAARAEIAKLPERVAEDARARFAEDLEELFWAASWLHEQLQK
jgi:hypothetical protein